MQLPSRHFNVRIPGVLWWRLQRRMEERESQGFARSDATGVLLHMIEQGLGPMTVDEQKSLRRLRMEMEQSSNGSEAPSEEGTMPPGPPSSCPNCEEGPEVPLVGGPIFRVSSSDRTFSCNHCGFEGRY